MLSRLKLANRAGTYIARGRLIAASNAGPDRRLAVVPTAGLIEKKIYV
jgi:hypothetical protein